MILANHDSVRILILRGGALGDFVLILPAIRALRDDGCEVHVADEGPAGLVLALELSPDLVVLDLQSAGADAPGVFQALRRQSRLKPHGQPLGELQGADSVRRAQHLGEEVDAFGGEAGVEAVRKLFEKPSRRCLVEIERVSFRQEPLDELLALINDFFPMVE